MNLFTIVVPRYRWLWISTYFTSNSCIFIFCCILKIWRIHKGYWFWNDRKKKNSILNFSLFFSFSCLCLRKPKSNTLSYSQKKLEELLNKSQKEKKKFKFNIVCRFWLPFSIQDKKKWKIQRKVAFILPFSFTLNICQSVLEEEEKLYKLWKAFIN